LCKKKNTKKRKIKNRVEKSEEATKEKEGKTEKEEETFLLILSLLFNIF
jgi:hypothetical protein